MVACEPDERARKPLPAAMPRFRSYSAADSQIRRLWSSRASIYRIEATIAMIPGGALRSSPASPLLSARIRFRRTPVGLLRGTDYTAACREPSQRRGER